MGLSFYIPTPAPPWPPELPWTEEFTGADGSLPSTTAWSNSPGDYASIQNNKLNFDSPGDNTNPAANFYNKITLVGDFNLQFDFDITTLTAPSDAVSYACILYMLRESDNVTVAQIGRGRSTVNQRYVSDGPDGGPDSYTTADSSGKIKVTRVSNEITVFVWSGGQWEYDGNVAGRVTANSESGNLYAKLYFEQENNSTVNSNIDNFTINSADGLLAR